MKNQTEWIIRGVFIVIGLGVIAYAWFGKRDPVFPAEPEKPPLGKVALPQPNISYKNALPAGDNGSGGGGGGMAGGPPLPGGATMGGAPPLPGGGGGGGKIQRSAASN